MIYKNGDKSEGNWVNEKREGHGIIEYANGDKFDGNFINDKKEGKGMCQYSDGSKYEGEFYFFTFYFLKKSIFLC